MALHYPFRLVAVIILFVIVLVTGLDGGAAMAQTPPSSRTVKFPVTLDTAGYQAALFDVGACLVSGQPSEETLRKLAKEGYKTVVCLRTQPEMDDRTQVPFDEPALLNELNIKYVHIPLGAPGSYRPDAVKQFAEALEKSDGKVLLHCTVAWRASYMWMAYLISNHHYSVDEAWKSGMAMNITVDRTPLMLDQQLSYISTPHKNDARNPKDGILSKPGSKLTITSPKVVNAPTANFRDFVLWDLGSVLNASQPDEKKFRELAAQGVKTVVNLRTPQEMAQVKSGGFDEEAVAKQLSLKYVSVPLLAWQTFTPANLALIADAFEKSDGKILFHCGTAVRSTQALIPYLVKYQGMDVDEATKVGESMRWQQSMLPDLLGMDFSYKLKQK
jgi:uncharacterized protein (TIGR01244 family)